MIDNTNINDSYDTHMIQSHDSYEDTCEKNTHINN